MMALLRATWPSWARTPRRGVPAIALALLFATLAAAQESDTEDVASGGGTQTIIATQPADVPTGFQGLVKDRLAKAPAGAKVRLVLAQIFDQSPKKVITYLYAVATLDADGQPDGEESFHKPWRQGATHTITWKHGVKDGPERFYSPTDDGRFWLNSEIPWQAGKIHGVKRTIFITGKVQNETTYVAGEASGPAVSYDEQGRITRRGEMRAGKRHGEMVDFWPETGKPKRVVQYADGKAVGLSKEFYANGQVKRELPFLDNAMHGEEKQYDADGTLARTRWWLRGDSVSEEEFRTRAAAKP